MKRTLGARRSRRGIIFTCFVTTTDRVAVRVDGEDYPMKAVGGGFFKAHVDGIGPGASYKFVLDEQELPDPYARYLPNGVHGPATIYESKHRFRSPGVSRPLREQVIYELHIGTFTTSGTYLAAVERLPDLVRLGVTTLEVMPLSSFAGSRGWGYDGVAHFAPFAGYGSPDDLRELIDSAHELGLSVLLDVVYNHFGPAGNYLRAYSQDYFTSLVSTPWGDAPDYSHPMMRRFVLDNARYWLEEFRFDGLRLDAVQTIFDRSEPHILRELANQVAQLEPRKILIAETDENDPATVTVLGCDAVWADDFHHQLHVTLTGERDGYYAGFSPGARGIADVITRGWLRGGTPPHDLEAEHLVFCIQNHDQIGNRAFGDRLSSQVSLDAYAAISTLLLLLPMTPLLFMGQEWAASSPFIYFTDHEPELGELVRQGRREEFKRFASFSSPEAREKIPDPQALETFEASRLRWEERDQPGHHRILELYRDLLSLRQTDPVLRAAGRKNLRVEARGMVMVVRFELGHDQRALVLNLDKTPIPLAEVFAVDDGWTRLFTTSDFSDNLPAESAVLYAKRS